MKEDYTQPFYVPYEMARRLGYDKSFYLPPLEISDKIEPPPKPEPPRHILIDRIEQLEGRSIYLQNKINTHLDKTSSKRKQSKYD